MMETASHRNPDSPESFVKTFKRDYVRVHPLPDALTAFRQIAGWFEDYNDNLSGVRDFETGLRST